MNVYNRLKRKIVSSFCDGFAANYYSRQLCCNEYRKDYHDIIISDKNYGQIEKTNNVWIMWLQGEEKAPDLVRACITSIRKYLPGYQVHILSEDNMLEYLSDIPDRIMTFYYSGAISKAHFSDIARAYLLYHYGGYWFDATCFVTGTSIFSVIEQHPFFVYKSIDTDRSKNGLISSSWFIWSYKNNRLMGKTLDLLYQYWNTHSSIDDYFLFHIMFKLVVEQERELWCAIPDFNNISPHMLQFEFDRPYNEERWKWLMSFSDVHKLNHHASFSTLDKGIISNYDHICMSWRKEHENKNNCQNDT